MTLAPAPAAHGVHSEVGTLRKVLVCRPGLAHERLTPTNSDDLLFDDVLWVEQAQRDHDDFVGILTSRGVDVVELHELLAQTMAIPEARTWPCERAASQVRRPVASCSQVRASVSTTLGGLPRVCRGP